MSFTCGSRLRRSPGGRLVFGGVPNMHRTSRTDQRCSNPQRVTFRRTMDPSATPANPQIAEAIDPARLFQRAEEVFAGRFILERLVAADTVRALFVARHPVLRRRVALRVHLQPDTAARTWFERETVLLAQVDHPGIRPIYSGGYRGDWAYRITKWIDGESLHDAVARGPRPIPAVLQMARDLISALDYAHGKNIIIRRIVPTALMLTGAGRAIITDLRWANPLLDIAGPDIDPALETFLAPETRGGRPGEYSSDLYTAAALLYFAVTGIAPPSNPVEIQPPSTLRASCPRLLDRVILRAIQLEGERRYQTAEEMGDDLLSELGDYDFHTGVPPSAAASADDPVAWEKFLRRALGEEYELLSLLGDGAFGRVYRVRDLSLEREVALKILHPFLTSDPAVLERFRREAQLAAQVRHPHIVDVFDYGGRAGLLWYTMAYIRGENLAQLIERLGPLELEQVVRLLEQSLSALEHAHARGLVHRDLKPENLLVELPDWNLQITDFGLAVAMETVRGEGGTPSRSGTPAFAAPEQLLGEPVDERSDLYSLSIVALYALLGRSPFGSGPIEVILARQTSGQLPDVQAFRDDVPNELLRVLVRGAAQHPADRYPNATAYAAALTKALRRWRGGPLGRLRALFGRH